MKIRLIKEPDKFEKQLQQLQQNLDTTRIEMEFEDEALPDILDNMTNFLRGCGFTIDYDSHLEIIKEGE